MNNSGRQNQNKNTNFEPELRSEETSKKVQFHQVMEIKNEAETIKFSEDEEEYNNINKSKRKNLSLLININKS